MNEKDRNLDVTNSKGVSYVKMSATDYLNSNIDDPKIFNAAKDLVERFNNQEELKEKNLKEDNFI